MLLPSANYLRVIACEHDAEKRNEDYIEKATDIAKGGLRRSTYIPVN